MVDCFSTGIPVKDTGVSGRYRVTWTFDAGFIGFKGHFPDRPVLPGVCQILAISVFAGRAIGRNLRLGEIAKAKFLSVIEPGETVEFSFTLSDIGGTVCLCGQTSVEGKGMVGKFKLVLEVVDA